MIPKSGTGFRKRSCSNNKLERDDDSKKSHPALGPEALQPSLFSRCDRNSSIEAKCLTPSGICVSIEPSVNNV
jgi:hypothetical protein